MASCDQKWLETALAALLEIGPSSERPTSRRSSITGGLLYLATETGVLSAVDAESGKTIWKTRLGGNFSASPLAAPGDPAKIVLANEEGELFVDHRRDSAGAHRLPALLVLTGNESTLRGWPYGTISSLRLPPASTLTPEPSAMLCRARIVTSPPAPTVQLGPAEKPSQPSNSSIVVRVPLGS